MFNFGEKDPWIIPKVKEAARKAGIELVTTTALGKETNLISPDPAIRTRGVEHLKLLVDINHRGVGPVGRRHARGGLLLNPAAGLCQDSREPAYRIPSSTYRRRLPMYRSVGSGFSA
jgi:hypothetical protein